MATSSRLRGNVLPIFTLKLGAAAAASYADDLKKISLTSADKPDSDLTFAEAAAGIGKDYTVKLTTLVSFDAGALYGYIWSNRGASMELVWGPYGNAAPSVTKPHFKLTVLMPTPDLETEASAGVVGSSADIELKGTSALTLVTA